MKQIYCVSNSLGIFILEGSEQGLSRCEILSSDLVVETSHSNMSAADSILQRATAELRAYINGNLKVFSVPLDLSALKPFQKKVLAAVQQIPRGETRTYAQVAAQVRQPKAARAVGNALAHNPLMLFIPCHRVIGSDGTLHGFSAPQGLELKTWLLEHEGHKIRENKLLNE